MFFGSSYPILRSFKEWKVNKKKIVTSLIKKFVTQIIIIDVFIDQSLIIDLFKGVCLCHGECSKNSLKDGFSIKSLSYVIRKLVNFLMKNKNEIITLFLEDYIRGASELTSVFNRVKNFNSLQFNPYASEWDVLNKGWPKISDMINANKRFLIVDDEKRGLHVNKLNGIIRSRDYFIENHYTWVSDDDDQQTHTTKKNGTTQKLSTQSDSFHYSTNQTEYNITIPRCYSLHRVNRRPVWDETRPLNLSSREHPNQLLNRDKLFFFNHFYGIPAKSVLEGNTFIYDYINSNEFVTKRLLKKCNPNTSNKRPNYIALDFVDESTYKNLILPMNENAEKST